MKSPSHLVRRVHVRVVQRRGRRRVV